MNILALDLGTVTGYALYTGVKFGFSSEKDKISFAEINFHERKKQPRGKRFYDFRTWLGKTIKENFIQEVCYECVARHNGTCAAHCYGYFQGTLEEICYSDSVKLTLVPVKKAKKWITGNGNSSKETVFTVLKKKYKELQTYNEADALSVLLTQLRAK